MARPTKSAKLLRDRSENADVLNERIKNEERLRGKADKIVAPIYLSRTQKAIFNAIVKGLKESGILSNLDIYILESCSIAIDRIRTIEKMINDDPDLLFDSSLVGAKNKYTAELFRCANELSLSPQSRAKLANINVSEKKTDVLADILSDLNNGQKPVRNRKRAKDATGD